MGEDGPLHGCGRVPGLSRRLLAGLRGPSEPWGRRRGCLGALTRCAPGPVPEPQLPRAAAQLHGHHRGAHAGVWKGWGSLRRLGRPAPTPRSRGRLRAAVACPDTGQAAPFPPSPPGGGCGEALGAGRSRRSCSPRLPRRPGQTPRLLRRLSPSGSRRPFPSAGRWASRAGTGGPGTTHSASGPGSSVSAHTR